jgi:hypothetical protein
VLTSTAVTFDNGIFLATANDGTFLVSTNGRDWEQRYVNSQNLRSATYAAGQWVLVGNYGAILTSSNLIDWIARPAPTDENLHGVNWFVDRFVAVSNRGTVLYSAVVPPFAHLDGAFTAKGFQLRLISDPVATFQIEATDSLLAPNWKSLGVVTATGGVATFIDASAGNDASPRFYRAVAQ